MMFTMAHVRLLASVFVSGAVVMALELLGSRLLAPVFGNSIFVWGSLIGVVLAALSAGYYAGGWIADRRPSFQVLSTIIFAAGILILVLPTLTRPIFDAVITLNLGERYSPLVATMVLLAPPSVLLGMVSPYAIRLVAKGVETLGRASGNLYALSTLGSIVGTFVTVFILIPEFGVDKIIVGIAALLLVIAFLGLSFRLKVLVLFLLISIPFAAPYLVGHRLTVATYTLALGDTIYETDTPYHHLLVADAYDPTRLTTVRYLILDDNFHSAMDIGNPDRTVFAYTDYFHIGFLLNPNITSVLFIGGGGFTGPKAFLKDYPDVLVDVVEIDYEVIRVAQRYFNVDRTDPRLRIFNEDGRTYIQKTTQKYDLVVLDAYSRTYVPFHLMTREFFKEVSAHLTAKGIIVSNLISRIPPSEAQLLRAEVNTLNVVFPRVYTFAVRGPDFAELQNVILLATRISTPMTEIEFQRRAESSTIPRSTVLRNYVGNLFTLEIGDSMILTDNFAPVETLLNPITGQPLVEEGTLGIVTQEAARAAVVLFVGVIIVIILARRKLI